MYTSSRNANNIAIETQLGRLQRHRDPQREQLRHERVILVASCTLLDLVNAKDDHPHKYVDCLLQQSHETEDLLTCWQTFFCFLHGPSGDHMKRSFRQSTTLSHVAICSGSKRDATSDEQSCLTGLQIRPGETNSTHVTTALQSETVGDPH